MNYGKIYESIVSRAASRTRCAETYYERHHILPKCLGGDNSSSNLVYLTAEEHFVAHQLLVKMHPGNNKLLFAAHMMSVQSGKHVERLNNKEVSWLKRNRSKALSVLHKGKIVSEETRKKMSTAKKGRFYGEKNNFYGKTHSLEFRLKQSKRMKESMAGSKNNNAKEWNIQFPDGSINKVVSLKTFCEGMGISLYRMRNNTLDDFRLIGGPV